MNIKELVVKLNTETFFDHELLMTIDLFHIFQIFLRKNWRLRTFAQAAMAADAASLRRSHLGTQFWDDDRWHPDGYQRSHVMEYCLLYF